METYRAELVENLVAQQSAFGLALDDEQTARLADYYELVMAHNPLLHLVGPCSPAEFASRHVLESLTLLQFLATGAKLADVGSGAGLPAIPCLIVREDLRALLIESKEKKAAFLGIAVEALGLAERATVVNRQFAETDPSAVDVVTCRALDKLSERLPRMLKWAGRRCTLLFGGKNLEHIIREQKKLYRRHLMPLSDQRFLFVIN